MTSSSHECTNKGKVKRLKLWWQLYVTWLPVRDLENFRPMDFCWTECTCSGLLQHVVGSLFPEFWRNILSSFSAFTRIPEDEGGMCSWTVGKKLPDYTVQWPRTSGSTKITWWKPQITVFILLRIYLFLTRSCPSFIVSCWCRPVCYETMQL